MQVCSGGRDSPNIDGANSVRGGDVDWEPDLPVCVMSLQALGSPARDFSKRPTAPPPRSIALDNVGSCALQNPRVYVAHALLVIV